MTKDLLEFHTPPSLFFLPLLLGDPLAHQQLQNWDNLNCEAIQALLHQTWLHLMPVQLILRLFVKGGVQQ